MYLELLSYNHPFFWLGIGLVIGTIQGLISAITANMASRRGLEWQTAFLLSYLPLVPLIWVLYSSKRVRVLEGRYILRWPSIFGAILLVAGLLLGVVNGVIIEILLVGPPISVLGLQLSNFLLPSAVSMLMTMLGLSFIVGRLVASWSNILENEFLDDWKSVFGNSKRKEEEKEGEGGFTG